MDVLPSERPLSVLSLVKRLAGERWISAYETLLDLSGEHRYGTVPTRAQEHLSNIISELRIIGNISHAMQLKRLTESFTANHEHANALLVLLLCADTTREKRRNFPQFALAEITYPQRSSMTNTLVRVFTPDDIAEPDLRKRELFTSFSEEDETAEPRDCIADSSHCEHESYNLWLRHNLSEGHNPGEQTIKSRCNLHASALPLHSTTESKVEPTTRDKKLVRIPHRLRKNNVQVPQNDSEICRNHLHRLFHMCIAGPNIDQQSDSESLLRPTPLFEASAVNVEKPSVAKSQAFARRRKITLELKAWEQRLRYSPSRRNVAPSSTRALMCGLAYQSVLSFGPVYLSEESSTALKAVVSYIVLRADSYVGAILKLADPASADPAALELIVLDTAESFSGHLREIGRVLEGMEETDGSSESILSIVSNHLRRSPFSEPLQELFLHVTRKYENVLRDWVMEGSCVPEERILTSKFTESRTELTGVALNLTGRLSQTQFVTSTLKRSVLFSENQALFFRRAGHGRAILRQLMLGESYTQASESSELYPTEQRKQQQQILKVSTETVNEPPVRDTLAENAVMHVFSDPLEKNCSDVQSVSNRFEALWSTRSYFTFAEETPVDGSNMLSLALSEEKLTTDTASWEFGRFNTKVYPTLYAELTVARFRKVDEEVQRKIFERFVKDLEVFAHLDFIRKYILLGAGDFANALVEQINSASSASESSEIFLRNRKKAALTFYGSADAGNRQVRSLLHLKRCFRTAMYLFNTGTERFASHLELESSSNLDEAQVTGELWDHRVDFLYDVPDPLKLIISTEVMSMYSKIHAFFLRVHRAKTSLRNLFMDTRRQSALNNMPLLSLLRNRQIKAMLWLFCMDSEQFVNTLGGFFMDEVIGSAWESFKCLWESCESVWALQDAHRRFLEGSMQRCLLDPRQKNLRNVIGGGFDIIHNVEKEMAKLHESSTLVQVDLTTLRDLISSASASLRRRAVFLSDVLERLSEAGSWHTTSFVSWW